MENIKSYVDKIWHSRHKSDIEKILIDYAQMKVNELNKSNVIKSVLPTDTEIEEWMFYKIGKRETMTEKEYLIGMIMPKHIRDEWEK